MVNGADLVTHHVRAAGSNGLELQNASSGIIVSMGAGGGTQASFTGAVTANSISASTINGLGNPLAFSQSVDARINAITASGGIPAGTVSSSAQILDYGIFATTGSNTFDGDQIINGNLTATNGRFTSNLRAYSIANDISNNPFFIQSIGNYIRLIGDTDASIEATTGVVNITGSSTILSNTFTASLQQGYVWVGDGSNRTTLVATSSFGSSINTGSFATTGSNVFTGDQTLIDGAGNFFTITDTSGSMMLVAKSYTSASAHITSSVNQLNLLFKANGSTGETVISGSNNIFVNQNTPTTGFRKYVTAGNFGLSANALPQFSSSMGFSPTVSSNIFANQSSTPMTVRGPVSSSVYTIQNNALIGGTVNLGTAATTNFEKASNGLNVSANIINGSISATAYKTNFISSSAMAISANNIGGGTTLNADSSSISLVGNTIQNSSFVVNNSYYNASATGGGNSLSIGPGNAIFGSNTTIFASGSNTTAGTGRQFNANISAGTFNSASLNINGDNSNIVATAIIGHNLGVTGSAALQTGAPIRSNTYGSAFFGRFNAQDGTKALTAETVFAIGTGTTTTPKTGFLIDSGSNTFVEGTLNVSGATALTGAVNITGSFTVTGSLSTNGVNTFNGDSIFANDTSIVNNNSLRVYYGSTATGTPILQVGIENNSKTGFTNGAYLNSYASPMLITGSYLSIPTTVTDSSFTTNNAVYFNGSPFDGGVPIDNLARWVITPGGTQFSQNFTSNSSGNSYGATVLYNNDSSSFNSSIQLTAQQSGSQSNVIITNNSGSTSVEISANTIQLSGSIQLPSGTDKPAGLVTVNGSLTVTNSLVTSDSIILVTTQNGVVSGTEYPAVVTNKTNGSFEIAHNYGGNLSVGYLIINPI
jgi:hypothetical protein